MAKLKKNKYIIIICLSKRRFCFSFFFLYTYIYLFYLHSHINMQRILNRVKGFGRIETQTMRFFFLLERGPKEGEGE